MDIRNLFPLEIQVYIAGIRTPFSSVAISSAFNSIPTCGIELPPDPRLYGIGREDRVPVLIFGTDPTEGDEILLFEGEITSHVYTSSRTGKSITVEAQSVFAFMRDAKYQSLNSLQDFATAAHPGNSEAAIQGTGHPDFMWPTSLFMQGLSPVAGSSKLITSPTEYLDNVIAIINDPDMTKYTRSKIGDFYLAYSHNLNITKRYSRIPYFDELPGFDRTSLPWVDVDVGGEETTGAFPILGAVQRSMQVNALSEAAKMGGAKSGSFYDMMNQVTQHMEYEVSVIAAPYYNSNTGELVNMLLKPIFYDADPPECNIMYRPIVESVQSQETTYGVPTRVRVNDIMSPLGNIAYNKNDILSSFGTLKYYPSDNYNSQNQPPSTGDGQKLDIHASEVISSEAWTGPYLSDVYAPMWMSYAENIKTKVGNAGADLQEHVLAHLLYMAKSSARSISVQTAFNPYILPGFPGVVYDTEGTGFDFVGHVTSVQHNISKSGASTSVQMSYVRLLREEAVGDRLTNSYPAISEFITHDHDKMIQIYNHILGCDAHTYDWLYNTGTKSDTFAQQDPYSAFLLMRRPIITKAEYTAFMGDVYHQFTPTSAFKSSDVAFADLEQNVYDLGDAALADLENVALAVPGAVTRIFENFNYSADTDEFYGYYVQLRRDGNLRGVLREVAQESRDNTIYFK